MLSSADTWTGNGKAADPSAQSDSPIPPNCDICNDSLWIAEPSSDPESRITVVACKCQKDLKDSSAHLRTYAEMGQLERMTFDSLTPDGRPNRVDPDLFRLALEAAKRFAESPNGWFALEGPSGSGKTHLAAAIANDTIGRGQPVKYISALDIADLIRTSNYDQSDSETGDPFIPILTAPLLVVDDLGAHQNAPWIEAKIDQLLTHRSNRNSPTVIALAKPLADLPERIALKIDDTDLTQLFTLVSSTEATEHATSIPKNMLDRMTFDSFDPNGARASNPDQIASLNVALNDAQNYAINPEKWLYIHGPTGVGKTHLAVAIANTQLENGNPFTFWAVPDLLDRLRHAYSSDNEASFYRIFDEVRNADLLILDDFGAQNMTDWALEKIYQLIAHRHDRVMPTVITSQYIIWDGADTSYWQRLHGKQQWESIRSRLNDSSVVTERLMAAPDYRNRGA